MNFIEDFHSVTKYSLYSNTSQKNQSFYYKYIFTFILNPFKIFLKAFLLEWHFCNCPLPKESKKKDCSLGNV